MKLYEKSFGKTRLKIKDLPKNAGPYGDRLTRRIWRYLPPNIKHDINIVFANIGRSLAAYQRDITPTSGKLEKFINSLSQKNNSNSQIHETHEKILTREEELGLKLFINNDKTRCMQCHNGPLLTNGEFHNIGTASLSGPNMDLGRTVGLQAVLIDEFNCYGKYSNVRPNECQALRFVNTEDSHSPLLGAYKVPTLRGLSLTAPYGHDGRFHKIEDIILHYRKPPSTNHELQAIDLNDDELKQLGAFLKIL